MKRITNDVALYKSAVPVTSLNNYQKSSIQVSKYFTAFLPGQ